MKNRKQTTKADRGQVKNAAPSLTYLSAILPTRRMDRARKAQSLTSNSLEQTNPLRGLTLARAVALMEATLRGEYTQAAWTLWHIEQTDPDLFALISRRTSAIMEMDWDIKVISEKSEVSSQKSEDAQPAIVGQRSTLNAQLAAKQAATLRAAYEKIDNLSEAIEELSLAFCRGFTILQFESDQPTADSPQSTVSHLGAYKPWNILRAGLDGDWFFNPDARAISWRSLSAENRTGDCRIDPANHIIYAPRVCLMRIALYKFIRQNLSQKDWDAFIEIFGLPSAFIIGPPNVPAEKEPAYEAAALEAAEGGGGYLPNGADVKFADSPRGVNPFSEHLKYLQEQLILAGTGGLLTMLAQPTGIGAGASGAHEDTFKTIARGEAKKISEVFQKQFDKRILAAAFPGQPVLAYFEIAAKEEQDIGSLIKHALELSQAGYQMDPAELSEKTGYKITLAIPAGVAQTLADPLRLGPAAQAAHLRNPDAPAGPIANKVVEAASSRLPETRQDAASTTAVSAAVAETLGVRSDLLTPFFAAIEAKAADKTLTDTELLDTIEAMAKSLPELMTGTSVEAVAKIIEKTLSAAVVSALSVEHGAEGVQL